MLAKKLFSSKIFYFFLLTTIFVTFLRFPSFFINDGGIDFVIIYLVCLIIFAFPILLFEISIGKKHRCNIIEFYQKFFKKNFIFSFFQIFFGFFLIIFYFSFAIIFFTDIFYNNTDPQQFLPHSNIFSELLKYFIILIFLFFCFGIIFIVKNKKIKKNFFNKFLFWFVIIVFSLIFLIFILSFFLPGNQTGINYFFVFKQKYFLDSHVWFDGMSLSIFTYFLGTGSVYWFLKNEKTSLDTNKVIIFSLISNIIFIFIFSFITSNLIGNVADNNDIKGFINHNGLNNTNFLTIFKLAGFEENNIFSVSIFAYLFLFLFFLILLKILYFLLSYFTENIFFVFMTDNKWLKYIIFGFIYAGTLFSYLFYDSFQMAMFYVIFFNFYVYFYIFTYFFLYLKNPEEVTNSFIFADNNSKVKKLSSSSGHALFFCSIPLIFSIFLRNLFFSITNFHFHFNSFLSTILFSLFLVLTLFYFSINAFFAKISISYSLKKNILYFFKKIIFLLLFIIILVIIGFSCKFQFSIKVFDFESVNGDKFLIFFGAFSIINYFFAVLMNYYYLKKKQLLYLG